MTISLKESAPTYQEAKRTIERMYGREVTHDEFVKILFQQFTELPAEWTVVHDVQKRLNELKEHLEKHREPQAAIIVELFRDALTDVFNGKLSVPSLTDALLGAK